MASEPKLPPPDDYDPTAPLTEAEIKRLRPITELGMEVPRTKGRPRIENAKVPVTMRLDPDVLAYYKSTGPGWQTRMSEILAQAAAKKSA